MVRDQRQHPAHTTAHCPTSGSTSFAFSGWYVCSAYSFACACGCCDCARTFVFGACMPVSLLRLSHQCATNARDNSRYAWRVMWWARHSEEPDGSAVSSPFSEVASFSTGIVGGARALPDGAAWIGASLEQFNSSRLGTTQVIQLQALLSGVPTRCCRVSESVDGLARQRQRQ